MSLNEFSMIALHEKLIPMMLLRLNGLMEMEEVKVIEE